MNLALGTLYGWSVFVAPLEAQFGWKRADTSMVFTIAVIVFALSFVVAGRIQDKFGPLVCSLAVGLAVGGYGAGSAIFGPLAQLKLIPAYGLPATFQILGGIFLVMTMVGALLLRNPPAGYRPAGWLPAAALSTMTLVVGALGNASGRILSGWMSDRLGRINVLRTMIGICIVAMPALYAAGSNVVLLYAAVFFVYWCYGTQLSVNGVAASDFWGTKNAGINYGILFTAWGVAGIIGPRIGGVLYDRYHNYQAAFYTAAVLAGVALLCELGARRPVAIGRT